MKDLYLSIRTRLEQQITDVAYTKGGLFYVRLWNNQFQKSNNDDVNQNTYEGIQYPNCFIEFPEDNPMLSQGAGSKRLDVVVRLHIGFESYNLEDLTVFDLVDQIQAALENWKDTQFANLTYLAQRPSYDHDQVYEYQIDYRTAYTDNIQWIKKNAITKQPPTALDLSVDLDIDNPIIRTGDGS